MSHLSRPPRGQQRDKPYREALHIELAAAGEDMKKLREIARVHIARCEAGDMQAIKELADRLDGRPAQILEHSGSDSKPITKIIYEIVHMPPPDEIKSIEDMPQQPPPDPRSYRSEKLVARKCDGCVQSQTSDLRREPLSGRHLPDAGPHVRRPPSSFPSPPEDRPVILNTLSAVGQADQKA
jgi:hypothetical protein